jgi:hypothetical protein
MNLTGAVLPNRGQRLLFMVFALIVVKVKCYNLHDFQPMEAIPCNLKESG